MSGCGCNKQSGGGSKRCSCKKCRRYSQKGGGIFDGFFGSSNQTPPPSTTPSPSTTTPTTPSTPLLTNAVATPVNDDRATLEKTISKLTAEKEGIDQELDAARMKLNALPRPQGGGGGGGNMMFRQNFHGGYGELVTAQDEAIIGLDSGPSIATQGIATQQGGKHRTRKIRKTRRMKKSRKHMKSRKYRR